MKIEWTIKKQRGRFRAVLEYTISLEQWEKDLNPEQQVVKIVTGKEKNTGRYVDGDLSDQIGNKYYRADVTSEPGADTVTLRYYGNNHEYPEIKRRLRSFQRSMRLQSVTPMTSDRLTRHF